MNIETIRFYQRRGLLVEPVKPFNSFRHYTERDVQRIRFIKQGQKLGFSLDEILELLSLDDGQLLIRERIEGLRTMETALSNLVENCTSNTESVSCPIILALQLVGHRPIRAPLVEAGSARTVV